MNPNRTAQDDSTSNPSELSQSNDRATTASPNFKAKFKPSKPRSPFTGAKLTISFEIPAEIAPAFRSAVDEISNELGGRLEGPHSFDREEALTDAVMALAALRASFFSRVPAGHRSYDR